MTSLTDKITAVVPFSSETFKQQISGSVFTPHDAGYDQARATWNLAVRQHPALIVEATNSADIVAALRYARDNNLGVAVKSTGHGVVREADGALLIVTSRLTDIRIDAENQTAWVGAGNVWGAVLDKAQAVGLAPLLGSSPGVGVIGYTLGGGMGWLARKYGLSIDSVLYFEVVTADGRVLHVSDTENSDLFWALRGGGGAFGVVTGMKIRLYPVSMVYGGTLVFPADQAKALLTFYRDWINTLPDEFTTSIALMNLPPLPDLPEFLRGKSVVMLHGCYVGPVEQGEAFMQPWHAQFTPLAAMFGPMPFSQVGAISNDPKDPVPGYSSGAWMRDLSDETIDTLIAHGVSVNGSSPLVKTEIRHAGGAMARVNPHANAYGNRSATLLMQTVGITPTPEARQHVVQYTQAFKAALTAHLTGGVYMNFVEGKESVARIKDGFLPESYRRLMAIKAKYDPANVFRFGFNIPPLASGDLN